MRTLYALALLAGCLALAHAFPGLSRESVESMEVEDKKDGVVLVLPLHKSIFDEQTEEERPLTTSLWRPFTFSTNPLDILMFRINSALNKIRNSALEMGQSELTPWGKIPEGSNRTSTTKIINDHAVTINETSYSDGNEDGATIFRMHVIEVKPLNETVESTSEEETGTKLPDVDKEDREELTTPASRSVETIEEIDNEIPKSQVDTLSA